MESLKQFEPLWDCWYIKELLGEGGFGKVFRIEREEFGNTYIAALKHIRVPQNQSEVKSIMADGMTEQFVEKYFETFVEDIVKEFVLMSKLKGNSHIVSYEDHKVVKAKNKIEWDIFIRMELLTSLIDYISKNSIRKKDVIQLGIDICKALETCQKYNIIHRDIKPENIFISSTGQFKLGDFGIARQIEQTASGLSKKGTFTYIAPEVYKGEAYGSTVDIYSLGIVMYRLLNNNRTPFMPPYPAPITHNDREAALVKRMSGESFEKPLNADGRLAEIVLKACAYKPKDRYENPTVMRKALEAILYNEEEASIIYPHGDKAEINSIKYISTEKDVKTMTMSNVDTYAMPQDTDYKNNLGEKSADLGQREKRISKKNMLAVLICVAAAGLAAGGFAVYRSNVLRKTEEAGRINALENKKQTREQNALAEAAYEKIEEENPYYSYLLYDIDKDGINELLIGSEDNTGYGVDIYCFSDGKAVKLGTVGTYVDAFENKYIFENDRGIGFVNKNDQKTEYGVWEINNGKLEYTVAAQKSATDSGVECTVENIKTDEEEYIKFVQSFASKKLENYIPPREGMPTSATTETTTETSTEATTETTTQAASQEPAQTTAQVNNQANNQTSRQAGSQNTTQKAAQPSAPSSSNTQSAAPAQSPAAETPAPPTTASAPEPTTVSAPEPTTASAPEPEPVITNELPEISIDFKSD